MKRLARRRGTRSPLRKKAKCTENARVWLSISVEDTVANVVEHAACPPQSNIFLAHARGGEEIFVKLSDSTSRFERRLAAALASRSSAHGRVQLTGITVMDATILGL